MIRKMFRISIKFIIISLIALFIAVIGSIIYIYKNKDEIKQNLVQIANNQINGTLQLKSIDLSIIQQFPYTTIIINDLKIFETKNTDTIPIIELQKTHLSFNLRSFINQNYQIKKIGLYDGHANIVQYDEDDFNVLRAFDTNKVRESSDTLSFSFAIDEFKIENLKTSKVNLNTPIRFDNNIKKLNASLKKKPEYIDLTVSTNFVLSVLKNNKPLYIKNKSIDFDADFTYNKLTQLINFKKTELLIEQSAFEMNGKIDVKNNKTVDLSFSGKKPNFDMLIAIAPDEIGRALKNYHNNGHVYFNTKIKGPTSNNQTPHIQAVFGCKNALIKERKSNKSVRDLSFHCTFTNGKKRNLSSSIFELKQFKAKPETGNFDAKLTIKNLISPEVNMAIDADLDLNFLYNFFNLKQLNQLDGQVLLNMKFHDIVDLQHPEKSLKKINQSYYSKLSVRNLNFKSLDLNLPVKNLNIEADLNKDKLKIDKFSFMSGDSDIFLNGYVTNIPEIIHKQKDNVQAELNIKSNHLNLNELSKGSIDEVLTYFKINLKYKGKGETFLVKNKLPTGDYYLNNFSGKFKHYKHKIDSIQAHLTVDLDKVDLKKLTGKIDQSDFYISSHIKNYPLVFEADKNGKIEIESKLKSENFYFKDIFTYKDKNFMPIDYQDEYIKNFVSRFKIDVNYDNNKSSKILTIKELGGKLKLHPLEIKNVYGYMSLKDNLFKIYELKAYLGNNDIQAEGLYHLSDQSAMNKLKIKSNLLNINELSNLNLPEKNKSNDEVEATETKSNTLYIKEKSFPNLDLQLSIKDLYYQNYHLSSISGGLTMKNTNVVKFNNIQFHTAEGICRMSGYFSGSHDKSFYFKPDLKIQNLNLEKVLLKFDNFGQNKLISENISGIFTGRIRGAIKLNDDFTPNIDDSNLTFDVSLNQGTLINFEPMQAMATFFNNRNLNRIRFDKIENRLSLKNGELSFPNMTINSSLGFIQLSGKKDRHLNMDYTLRIPLRLVGQAAFNRLFRRRASEINPEQEDELIIKDTKRRIRFVNIRLHGTTSNFEINLIRSRSNQVSFNPSDDFLFESIEKELIDDEK